MEEMDKQATLAPQSLDEVLNALKGYGLEESEEILTFESLGKTVKLRISNIPTEQEMKALLAAEEFKGYAWIQRIRCEILSRAITWVNGIGIRQLPEAQRLVTDPTTGEKSDIQEAMRNILLGWGQEVVLTLWKVLMVHSDKIEKRMQASFPDSLLMTEVEKRFYETALKEIQDANKDIIEDAAAKALEEGLEKEGAEQLTEAPKDKGKGKKGA